MVEKAFQVMVLWLLCVCVSLCVLLIKLHTRTRTSSSVMDNTGKSCLQIKLPEIHCGIDLGCIRNKLHFKSSLPFYLRFY